MDQQDKKIVEELVTQEIEKALAQRESGEIVAQEVEKALTAKVTYYRVRFRYFFYGLGALVILLVISGLFGGGDIVRTIHNKAFLPNELNKLPELNQTLKQEKALNKAQEEKLNRLIAGTTSEFPAISYETTLQLRGGQEGQLSGALYFFAVKGQTVEVHAQLLHRFPDAQRRNRVVVSVDGIPISQNSYTDFGGGFHDISDKLSWERLFKGEPNVHDISFSLDDRYLKADAWVTIICVVLVKHD